jgi:hypothetical protein
MVQKKQSQKKQTVAQKQAKINRQPAVRQPATMVRPQKSFGPISTISSAPVAMGNSLRGVRPSISNIPGGIQVKGRDFALTPLGTGSVVTWTPSCGIPLHPAAFGSSNLKQYMNMYSKYRFRTVYAHYITSSPTSANGDVLLYYQPSRSDPMLNWTSTNYLPYVLSSDETVMGPQWTNHSALHLDSPTWYNTDIITDDDLADQCSGDMFLFTKTSTTDSPGYVVIDYVVEFKDMQLNIKNVIYPISRLQWTNCAFALTTSSVTTTTRFSLSLTGGVNIAGVSSNIPSSLTIGDIYKVFFDVTNSSFTTNITANNIMQLPQNNGSDQLIALTDGYTLYARCYSGGDLALYPTYEAAITDAAQIVFGTSATVTFNLVFWASLCGAVGSTLLQSNI